MSKRLWDPDLQRRVLQQEQEVGLPGVSVLEKMCCRWVRTVGSLMPSMSAASLAPSRPAQLDVGLIASALQCRQADADPDSLFAARTLLPSQVEGCAEFVTGAVRAG